MAEETTFQKRQVAYKVPVSLIIESQFQKDELSAGFIQINSLKIARVNIIGTIVYASDKGSSWSATLDDGTGRINLRTFEQNPLFLKNDVGDLVMVIGRIREFSNEKYIIPEIIKKIDNVKWFDVRKKEIEKSDLMSKVETNKDVKDSSFIAEEIGESDFRPSQNDDIYGIIKSLDLGDGAPIEEVIEKSANKNSESIINKLLENGDIFEVKPGKLKVLE